MICPSVIEVMVEFSIKLDFKTVDPKKAFSSKFLLTNETALPHSGWSMILCYLTKYISRPHFWPIVLSI